MILFTHRGKGLHGGAPAEAWIEATGGAGVEVQAMGRTLSLGPGAALAAGGTLATDLAFGQRRLRTVEHWLSAVVGLGVGGVRLVCVEGDELPAAGGDALAVCAALRGAALPALVSWSPPVVVCVRQGRAWARWEPGEGLEVAYRVDFEGTALGRQSLEVVLTPERYLCDIASARTFAVAPSREAFLLARQRGVGAGLEETGGFVAGPRGYWFGQPRRPDEAVRHKVLDLMGDLGLLGVRPEGRIEIDGGGHRLHRALARAAVPMLGLSNVRRTGSPLQEGR